MKKRFDFDIGLGDDDADLDNDLTKQIDKIELGDGKMRRGGHSRGDSVVSGIKDGPYTGETPMNRDVSMSMVSMIQTTVAEEPTIMTKAPVQQMSSAQIAAKKIQEQNKMPLKIGAPAAEGAEDCEIYGGENPDINIDLINQ